MVTTFESSYIDCDTDEGAVAPPTFNCHQSQGNPFKAEYPSLFLKGAKGMPIREQTSCMKPYAGVSGRHTASFLEFSTQADTQSELHVGKRGESFKTLQPDNEIYQRRLTPELQANFEVAAGIFPVLPSQLPDKQVLFGPIIPGKVKTAFIDLDETLIHSMKPGINYDLIGVKESDWQRVSVPEAGTTRIYNYIVRPYAKQFLELLSHKYEIVVYTGSCKNYAEAMVSLLDEKREIIAHILSRESCVVCESLYLKNLSIVKDRKIENMIIIDNMFVSFLSHMDNGIYIPSFFGQKDDIELITILKFLLANAEVSDVREALPTFAGVIKLFKEFLSEHRNPGT